VLLSGSRLIAESCLQVVARHRSDRRRVGIYDELCRIVSVPFVRCVWAGKTKAIELPGLDSLDPHVPDVAGFVVLRAEYDAARRLAVVGTIKKVETDAGCVPAEDCKVHAIASRDRA